MGIEIIGFAVALTTIYVIIYNSTHPWLLPCDLESLPYFIHVELGLATCQLLVCVRGSVRVHD